MKATATPMTEPVTVVRPGLVLISELIKARLTFLVLLTALVGFYMGSAGSMDLWLMSHAMLGTGLLASGAAALNQFIERDHDARMPRTRGRPLPAGDLSPEWVLLFGGGLAAAGLIFLALKVNLLTGLLGAVTIGSYLFVYTPLKRVTSLNTAIGAIPGGLPPLMGWTAAHGSISIEGWALFAILCFWQLPHFLAIAWIYRDEYAHAGFKMLPVMDPSGERTGRHALSHTLGLLAISLSPVALGMVGEIYLFGALMLGLAFVAVAARFARDLSLPRARTLFLTSILYLPLLLALMVIDRTKIEIVDAATILPLTP